MFAALGALMSAQAKPGSGNGYTAIPPDACSVFAEGRAKPGKADEVRSITLPLIALVRGDLKNLVYFFQENRESHVSSCVVLLCNQKDSAAAPTTIQFGGSSPFHTGRVALAVASNQNLFS
jgi:hypothetical protein